MKNYSIIFAMLLMVAAVKIGIGGVENVLKALHGEIVPMPGKLALWAAAISILAKEGMYQWTARVGRDVNAPLLAAMLTPYDKLTECQNKGDFTAMFALAEEYKTYPMTAVWDKFCETCGAPLREAWYAEVKAYEDEVLSLRK